MNISKKEKITYAKSLLRVGMPYRDIQTQLKLKFGSGVSNNKLKDLQQDIEEDEDLRAELTRVKSELVLYKKLYFELLEAMKERLK
ncbi:hypothetical protein NEF87_003119 [Candidatus Lokiarchaeum ossiferum]|uniref:Transposase n=1 Tax=Candidatus Lokiarchaeum ossiferum TaxID=2951803 RepID=A0ABY6HWA0_9ARCH|nr:hypothetical protein NEF87_003119 [Candidatus Lokiarchaeum sp. B-35]